MTRRAIRAQRKAKEEMRHAFQDLAASQITLEPEFAAVIRENCRSLYLRDDAPFTLPDGTEITPATPWQMPTKEQQ